MSGASAKRRVRANHQVLADRMLRTRGSLDRAKARLQATPRPALIAGGLAAGFLIGQLPARALTAVLGGLAGFSLRLLSTPLGPMAFTAMMAKRGQAKVDAARSADPGNGT